MDQYNEEWQRKVAPKLEERLKKLWADDPDQRLRRGGEGFCRLKRYDKKMEE
jgi:hypothetical protein